MNSIFSSVSGQFGKAMALGTLLPSAVALLLGLLLIWPYAPAQLPRLAPLESLDKEWQAVIFAAATVILSGLLYTLNVPIIRLYEGYYWRRTSIGECLVARRQGELDTLQTRRRNLHALLQQVSGQAPRHSLEAPLRERLATVARRLNSEFPVARSSVLPTILGNAIRSFENYPRHQYGISAIPLWPRLIAKIDKDYAAATDDAKTSFDFLINGSALSAGLALALLAAGAASPLPHVSLRSEVVWLAQVLLLLGLSNLFYRLSIAQAMAWGDMVKGAFDLYRWDLLKQMGYEQVPRTRQEERALWAKVSRQILFGDDPEKGAWIDEYAPTPPPRVLPGSSRTEIR
jgi:hypothetical protein